MLACDKTITLVRLNESGEGYSCMAIKGVSWYGKTKVAVQDRGLAAADEVKVRIPADNLPEGVMPATGDFIVLGTVASVAKQSELDAYTHAKVLGVGDNQRGRLPHVAVTAG